MRLSTGERLKEWRQLRGLTLRGLAQKAGVHASTLSRWEAGQRQPSLHELERILEALGASSLQRIEVLRGVEAPRAIRRLRELSPQRSPTVSGDLLRAMRMRQGWTQAETATRIGVSQGRLSKWECSEDWPSTERLHTLCYTLQAHAEEVVLLTRGTLQLSDGSNSTLSPEAWRERIAREYFGEVRDLRSLVTEAELWSLAAKSERGKGLLRLAHAYRFRGFVETKRFVEANELLLHLKNAISVPREEDVEGMITLFSASLLSERDPLRSARILQKGISETSDLEYRSWMLGEYSVCLAKAEIGSEALRLSEEACRIAGDTNKLGAEQYRLREKASVLMTLKRYEAALTALEPEVRLMVYSADGLGRRLLLEAECFLGLGLPSEAADRLSRVEKVIEMRRMEYLRPSLKALTLRL